MDKRAQMIRRLRAVIALVLVVLYAVGLALMLASQVTLALTLWVVSTLGGLGLLFWIKTEKDRAEAEKNDAPKEP